MSFKYSSELFDLCDDIVEEIGAGDLSEEWDEVTELLSRAATLAEELEDAD